MCSIKSKSENNISLDLELMELESEINVPKIKQIHSH